MSGSTQLYRLRELPYSGFQDAALKAVELKFRRSSLQRQLLHDIKRALQYSGLSIAMLRLKGLQNLLEILKDVAEDQEARLALSEVIEREQEQVLNPVLRCLLVTDINDKNTSDFTGCTESELLYGFLALQMYVMVSTYARKVATDQQGVQVLIRWLSHSSEQLIWCCLECLLALLQQNPVAQDIFLENRGFGAMAALMRDMSRSYKLRMNCTTTLHLLCKYVYRLQEKVEGVVTETAVRQTKVTEQLKEVFGQSMMANIHNLMLFSNIDISSPHGIKEIEYVDGVIVKMVAQNS
eukprot:TRINITY_DN16558_c0_g4_i1.p1 TRINITY_DN16558_c0_g4~~TRINITY_DN16558_c0_g4_i1.p1  ORF type:complete len:337 (-),score=14.63 TRINITY_DN16558_c0_g4_i1:353-1237(-)